MKRKYIHGKVSKVNSKGCKPETNNIANIRHLTKIITFLSEVEAAHTTDIVVKLGMGKDYVKSGLHFLKNNKIIMVVGSTRHKRWNGGVKHYALNPLFK